MIAVDVERDAAVLVDAGAVEEQHQVAPLAFLCELGQPEADRRVRRCLLQLLLRCACTSCSKESNGLNGVHLMMNVTITSQSITDYIIYINAADWSKPSSDIMKAFHVRNISLCLLLS